MIVTDIKRKTNEATGCRLEKKIFFGWKFSGGWSVLVHCWHRQQWTPPDPAATREGGAATGRNGQWRPPKIWVFVHRKKKKSSRPVARLFFFFHWFSRRLKNQWQVFTFETNNEASVLDERFVQNGQHFVRMSLGGHEVSAQDERVFTVGFGQLLAGLCALEHRRNGHFAAGQTPQHNRRQTEMHRLPDVTLAEIGSRTTVEHRHLRLRRPQLLPQPIGADALPLGAIVAVGAWLDVKVFNGQFHGGHFPHFSVTSHALNTQAHTRQVADDNSISRWCKMKHTTTPNNTRHADFFGEKK